MTLLGVASGAHCKSCERHRTGVWVWGFQADVLGLHLGARGFGKIYRVWV